MESSDDEPLVAVKKKKIKIKVQVKPEPAASSASAKKKRKREPDAVTSSSSSKAVKKGGEKGLKKRDRAERLQHAMQSFLWWNAKEPPSGWQWSTMEHAGVSFPDTYIPHGVKMLYDGKPVQLNLNQEEA
jgi:DNA topoisomerase-1